MAVAVGNVDAWVSVPGAGVTSPATFVTVIGTSTCSMIVSPDEVRLPGITGVVRDGILPGLYGYEAGQAAVGDMLAWFVRTLDGDRDTYARLEAEAAKLGPGETGLVALDWFNGNRSILADADLTGAIFGLTLHSSPSEIYRALLESIAFGNRRIIDNFTEHGLELSEIVAVGGIAERSPLTMQLIADTSGMTVHVPTWREIPARGAALFGAVAAGVYDDIDAAIAATRPSELAHLHARTRRPRRSMTASTRSTAPCTRRSGAQRRLAAARPQADPRRERRRLTASWPISISCARTSWRPTWRCPPTGWSS